MPLPDHPRSQGFDFVRSEFGPNKRVCGNFKSVERLAAATLIVSYVVVEAAVDRVRASFRFGIEQGKPISCLCLRLCIVKDPLAIGIECIVSGTQRRFTAALAVD